MTNIINKIENYLNEKNEYDKMKEILSLNGIICIKGDVAVASGILTLEAEKKFFTSKSFKNGNDYIVDYKLYQQISKFNKQVLKKWHEENNLPYYG